MKPLETFDEANARIKSECAADAVEESWRRKPRSVKSVPRWYCGMCEQWFKRSGDCPKCGFQLEKAQR